jgi:hypothetical protein
MPPLHLLYTWLQGAHLLASETSLVTWPLTGTPTLDYAARLRPSNTAWGVSVTRAMTYGARLTAGDATRVLVKKLRGVGGAAGHVSVCGPAYQTPLRSFLLHIFCRSGREAATLRTALHKVLAAKHKHGLGTPGHPLPHVILITVAGRCTDAVFYAERTSSAPSKKSKGRKHHQHTGWHGSVRQGGQETYACSTTSVPGVRALQDTPAVHLMQRARL